MIILSFLGSVAAAITTPLDVAKTRIMLAKVSIDKPLLSQTQIKAFNSLY